MTLPSDFLFLRFTKSLRGPSALFHLRFLIALVVCSTGAETVLAQNTWNKTGTANWNTPGNWSDGAVPGAGTFALINTGGTAVIGAGVSATARNVLVGRNSGGTLLIDGGYLKTIWTGTIGQNFGGAGVGTVTVQNGGIWDAGGAGLPGFPAEIQVGSGGAAGSLNILAGGTVNANSIKVGETGGGTGTLTMYGTLNVTETSTATLWVGFENTGIYNQYAGLASLRQITVGGGPGVTGTATVYGGTMDSLVMIIGDTGTGTLLQNGGLVRSSAYVRFGLQGGTGTLHLVGGVFEAALLEEFGGSGSVRLNGGTLRALGNESDFMRGFEVGDVTVEAGGAFIDTNGFSIGISSSMTGAGRLTKQGTGGLTLTSGQFYLGGTTVKNGTLTLSGSSAILYNSTDLRIADGSSNNALIEVLDGEIRSNVSTLGFAGSSTGRLTMDGGSWVDGSTITAGYSGSGTVELTDGNISSTGNFILGDRSTGSGTVTVDGGTFRTLADLTVGRAGTGNFEINGGEAFFQTLSVASETGGSGTVTINGGTVTGTGAVIVGVNGIGGLTLDGGSLSSVGAALGTGTAGRGTAVVESGTWQIDGDLSVGVQGQSSLTVNGGLVSATGITQLAGSTTSGRITLTNASGSAGALATGRITEGLGSGSLNFDGGILRALGDESAFISGFEAGDLTTEGAGGTIDSGAFAIGIANGFSGTGGLTKVGSGTLTMSGVSTYLGATSVDAGKLIYNGSNTGNSAVTVKSGAELGGSGTFSGTVTVANGGILTPGDGVGTLTVGSLVLNNTSDLRFTLGTTSDLISVTNGLTLDGLLSITAGTGFGEGSYTLFQYGGALINNGLSITASVPSGLYYSLDFSQFGFVNLIVEDAQYWDGAQTIPNGTVDGGSGTWNNSSTNWTTVDGNQNSAWTGDSVAVFTGAPGVVNLAETLNVSAIDFVTDGYSVSGPGAFAISGPSLSINTGSGVVVGIGSLITGSGTVIKTGDGTLEFTAGMDYAGGTTVKGGTLEVSTGGSINHSSGLMVVGNVLGDDGNLLLDGGQITASASAIGNQAGSTGSATVNSGTWTNTGDFHVGNSGAGTLNLNGGTISNAQGAIANAAGSSGQVTVNDGTWTNSGQLGIGGGTGTLTVNGGAVSAASTYLGLGVGGNGAATVNGGTLATSGSLSIGAVSGSAGSLLVTGGEVSNTTASIGQLAGSTGTATVTGGTWTSTGLLVGNGGSGSLLVDGGQVTVNGTTVTGNDATGAGSITLSDGTLSTRRVMEGSGAGTFVFDGGTLRALVNENDFLSGYEAGDVTTQGGGARIDSNSFAIGISSTISGAGPLTKLGTGTLTLSGNNAYAGLTTISSGVLQIGSGGTTGSVAGDILNNGTLVFNRSNGLTHSGVISGIGDVTQMGAGTVTLTGVSDFTGATTITNGTLALSGSGSIAESTGVSVAAPGIFDISDTTVGAVIESLTGAGDVVLGSKVLTVDNASAATFSGEISGAGGVTKQGAATLTLNGANTYGGTTTISAGTLQTGHVSALGTSAVSLGGGTTLALTSGTTLGLGSLNWADGGTFRLDLNSGSRVTVASTVSQSGTGVFSFTPGAFDANTEYELLTYATAGSVLTNWTANMIGNLTGSFSIRDNLDGTSTLLVIYRGSSSGSVINNDTPDFTPTNADFLVDGSVTAVAGGQVVNSLDFAPGSSVTIVDTLQVTSGNLTVNAGSASVSGGTLTTPGDLIKLGGGLLDLLGNVITGGNTNVNAGTLAVNGQLTTRDVLVQFGAWLKGSGLINGNVVNNGTVAPGNSPGKLTVNGNFTQGSSGKMEIEVADNAFDQFSVTGRAALAGTLQGIAFGGHQFEYGDQVPFLRAGSISGEFDQIVMPKNYRGRFLVNGNVGTLLVAPESYTLVAENQNQKNVAKALDSFIGKSGDRDAVSLALDLQTEDQYGNAFDQIAPGFYQSLTDMVIEQTSAQNQMLAQRLSAVRLGVRGFSVIGLDQAAIRNDVGGKNVLDAKNTKDVISPATETNWSVFVQGNGIFARTMNVSQIPNYRYDSGGFLVGADYQFGSDVGSKLIAGLYMGYQGTYALYANGGQTTINSALFGGYASFSSGGFYSDLIVGGSYNGYRASRSIEFSTIDRTARSSPDGGSFTTYLDAGYDWKVGGFTFGPLVSAQYTYAGTSGFIESGADSLDLKVSQQNANSIRTNIGGRIAFTWQVTDTITIVPEGRMFWQHEYLNGPRDINASLNGGSGPGFEYTTIAPGRDSVFAGAGVSANFGDRWSTYFYYNANFGREDFVSHMISGGLNFKF